MKEDTIRAIGKWFLAVGLVMLVTGIILSITVGTILTAIMIVGSILMNTVAITCMRYRAPKDVDHSGRKE